MSKYEEYLQYFLSKEKREPFCLCAGSGSVMLSAPHSVEQTRNGKPKYGEFQTGVLVRLLHDELDCPVIYKTCNCGDDANYDEVSTYKQALREYVAGHGIRYLIDLHQLAHWRVENIDIGTAGGVNTEKDPGAADVVQKHFAAAGIGHITLDTPFDASYPYTVSSYIARKCGIPCIQIEMNSRLLCEDYEDFCFFDILGALERIVRELGERGK